MSDTAAHMALSRMNHAVVALAPHYTSFAHDMQLMAAADIKVEEAKFMDRRAELCETFGYRSAQQMKPFAFADGFAIIPISGTLVNRFGGSYGWVTGYQFIRRQLSQAMADDDVKAIVYDVNSHGGEAAGCFELAADIRAASKIKPSMAMIDSNCYSAAYALGSAARKVVCTPSGGAGSIGVVAMHVEYSKMLDEAGIKVTFIQFGAHKTDGNPYEALSEDVKKDIQASVDKSGAAFVECVAKNRNIDAAKVKKTEARVYRADDALSLSLIDTIATPQEAMQVFSDELSGSLSTTPKEDAMSGTTNAQPGNQPANNAAPAQAAAPAGMTAEQVAAAVAAGIAAERTRVSSIMGCDEAKNRGKLANHLAMSTSMSLEEAKVILSAAAEEAKPAAPAAGNGAAFQAAMAGTPNPNVGADNAANGGGGSNAPADKAAGILGDFYAVTGEKPAQAKAH